MVRGEHAEACPSRYSQLRLHSGEKMDTCTGHVATALSVGRPSLHSLTSDPSPCSELCDLDQKLAACPHLVSVAAFPSLHDVLLLSGARKHFPAGSAAGNLASPRLDRNRHEEQPDSTPTAVMHSADI